MRMLQLPFAVCTPTVKFRRKREWLSMNITNNLYGGGNGDSLETAIVINVRTTKTGVEAEYAYIVNLYGEKNKAWHFVSQSLQNLEDKHYDVIQIMLANGGRKIIYFDISGFFARF